MFNGIMINKTRLMHIKMDLKKFQTNKRVPHTLLKQTIIAPRLLSRIYFIFLISSQINVLFLWVSSQFNFSPHKWKCNYLDWSSRPFLLEVVNIYSKFVFGSACNEWIFIFEPILNKQIYSRSAVSYGFPPIRLFAYSPIRLVGICLVTNITDGVKVCILY